METQFTTGFQYHTDEKIPLTVSQTPELSIPHRYRLVVLYEGTGHVKIKDALFLLTPPMALCLNDSDTLELGDSKPIKLKQMNFHPLFIDPNYEAADPESIWLNAFEMRDEQHQGIVMLSQLTAAKLLQLMANLETTLTLQPDAYWPCRARSYLIEALLYIDRAYNSFDSNSLTTSTPEPIDTDLNEIIIYLDEHFTEKVSLSTLTKLAATNRTSLIDRFKKTYGITPNSYIIQLRLRMAMSLLKNTALSIAEIMERCGFNDATYFARQFKRFTQMTPSAYRKRETWL